jgi:hypothetical protein
MGSTKAILPVADTAIASKYSRRHGWKSLVHCAVILILLGAYIAIRGVPFNRDAGDDSPESYHLSSKQREKLFLSVLLVFYKPYL